MAQGGFFSRLRSLFGSPTPIMTARANGEADSDVPRQQHYYFAHEYLPRTAESDAKELVDKLREDSAGNYLNFLWQASNSGLNSANDQLIPIDDLISYPVEIDDERYGVIVQFPRPERTLEAYFAAIIISNRNDLADDHRYFTLEMGDLDGSKRTVLCEWTEDRHVNYGDGPKPEKEAFVKSLATLLSNRDQG